MAEYFNNDLDDIVEDYFETGDFDYFDDEFELDDQQAHGNDSELENVDDLVWQSQVSVVREGRITFSSLLLPLDADPSGDAKKWYFSLGV